jgi:hypothetical protein
MSMDNQAPHSISALNRLPPEAQERYYAALLPPALLRPFQIDPHTLADADGRKLLTITGAADSSGVEIDLRHAPGAPDPLFYGHFADTLNGQIIVLLAIVNDPHSPRFDVDRLPDGAKTYFGTTRRNVAAEEAALLAGLAPGQVRRGLRMMQELIVSFEAFVTRLGHTLFFTEPLSYHNAVVFERYGFAYQQGRRFMESIHYRFAEGDLGEKLNGSTPFRKPEFRSSIRGRSWAVHDGIMGEPFTGVHMYKHVGRHAGISTFPEGRW